MEERINAIALQIVEEHGFELYDIEFKSSDKGKVLRVYVTSPNGVTLDQCASISRKINYELDIIDIIPHKYYLEVSSPGLERTLLNERHYRQAVGEMVKITYRKAGKNETITGLLKSVSVQGLSVEISKGKDVIMEEIPYEALKKARTVFLMNHKSRR